MYNILNGRQPLGYIRHPGLIDRHNSHNKQERVAMYNSLDPFGIAAACRKVQRAWWAHPFLLSEELTRLGARALALSTWQRAARLPGTGDLIPSVVYDERFQHPLWMQNSYF